MFARIVDLRPKHGFLCVTSCEPADAAMLATAKQDGRGHFTIFFHRYALVGVTMADLREHRKASGNRHGPTLGKVRL